MKFFFATAFSASLLAAAPAMSQPLSPWSEDGASAIRLIAGKVKPGAKDILAGVEIRLQPGWKTYWKTPGDSGVPPRFDWSGSENVAAVETLFPAPKRMSDGSGWSIGYDRSVVLPLRITPKEAGKPVTLRLAMDYAVCEKLCVPARGEASLTHEAGGDIDRFANADLERFLVRTPRPAAPGAADVPSVAAEHRDHAWEIKVTAAQASHVDLFAFGEGDWSPAVPKAEGRDDMGRHVFRLPVKNAPAGARITVVAVADEKSVEVPLPLDAGASKP